MILILSNHGDISTDLVIDWLEVLGGHYLRINSFDLIDRPINIKLLSNQLVIGKKVINTADISAVWFRKFGFFRKSKQAEKLISQFDIFVTNHISTEFARVLEVLEMAFSSAFWLTHPSKIVLNKYDVLQRAYNVGFKVPMTYIINTKKQLVQLFQLEDEYITKSIYDPLTIRIDGRKFATFTSEVQKIDIDFLPDTFIPSMIQTKVNKLYEVRTFYFCEHCYSMAIMSQLDSNTAVDFRKYNYEHPNRFLPYKLPNRVERQIVLLMRELGLNTGSLDFIVNTSGEYIFLEVNPTGQFGMVDYPCNYGLHKLVAERLIKEDK